ncbi:MAG: hypothetical protein ACK5LZ_04960 [Anaerorhabdus sp.]
MIIVNMPLKREDVKALAPNVGDDTHRFTFIKEDGMKLYFEDTHEDEVAGAKILKEAIKEKLGSAFYFNVEIK